MSTISNTTATNAATQTLKSKQQTAAGGDFASVLASKDQLMQLSGQFLDTLLQTMKGGSGKSASATAPAFPFSAAFDEVFGTTGPLPDFINMVTAKLKLSAEKNQALQDIAIRNQNITQTAENVQKIAAELKAAGIG